MASGDGSVVPHAISMGAPRNHHVVRNRRIVEPPLVHTVSRSLPASRCLANRERARLSMSSATSIPWTTPSSPTASKQQRNADATAETDVGRSPHPPQSLSRPPLPQPTGDCHG